VTKEHEVIPEKQRLKRQQQCRAVFFCDAGLLAAGKPKRWWAQGNIMQR